MEIEFADGNWVKAIEEADRILKSESKHVIAVQIRQKAEQKLNEKLRMLEKKNREPTTQRKPGSNAKSKPPTNKPTSYSPNCTG
jgi:hypothetical protein